jgi:hypothetical protein
MGHPIVSFFGRKKNQPPAPTPPAQASAVGYNTLTFNSVTNVDTTGTYASGFDWYPYNFFGTSSNLSTIVAPNSEGGITDNGDTIGPGGGVATACDKGGGTFHGVAFGGGAYFEASLHFDPAQVTAGNYNVGWPAFWSMAIEHLVGMSAQHWSGQATGYNHFIECDFLEYIHSVYTAYGANTYAGTMRDWSGISLTTFDSDNLRTTPAGTDFRQYHKVGFLWVPATVSTLGYAKFYFDDAQVGPTQSWAQYDATKPPPITVYQNVHSSDDIGWAGLAGRQVLPPGLLTASPSGYIVVGFRLGTGTTGATLNSAYIGESASSGLEESFDGNQVQLLFNGSPSISGLNGAVIADVVADPIFFTYDATKKLVVSFEFANTGTVTLSKDTSATGADIYYKTAAGDSGTTIASGLTEITGNSVFIWSLDIFQSPPFSVLDSQHLVPIIGTGVGMPILVNSVHVWQASAAANLSS